MTRLRRTPPRAAMLLSLLAVSPASGQDANILMPVDSIEALLAAGEFEVIDRRGSRAEGDRTTRTTLQFEDGTLMVTKWAPAPIGGEVFNNVPRFELGAYEIQKLFLDEDEYVVPPTVVRPFPLTWYRQLDRHASPTLYGTESILMVIQYWLFNVTAEGFWDEDRFDRDPRYARHLANFDVFTYLIEHADENVGNYLISTDADNPRVFAVDNGVSFSSERSDRGAAWRHLRVDRVPATTVARLRDLSRETLEERLTTLVQFRVLPDRTLERMPSGPSLAHGRGVRKEGGVIQLGLTRREIGDVWNRIQELLEDVDDGDLQLF